MDLVWILCLAASVCAWLVSSERHSVYWNSTNPKFVWNNYAVKVKLNDYLDIVCPHYPLGEVASQDAERYVLYMVEKEDYDACKPQSYDQMRWECSHPFAPHAPEKFSEKFQRFTPFTLGKEFRQGESYYYICESCLVATFVVLSGRHSVPEARLLFPPRESCESRCIQPVVGFLRDSGFLLRVSLTDECMLLWQANKDQPFLFFPC
uniref:Ephrin-A1 n=1 Tax=Gadus morhua TaxID=8049 RepID=A0A8C5AXJ1_GADMO